MGAVFLNGGVTDGARTHDNQNHNLGLYQLSYSHRKRMIIAESDQLTITSLPFTPREPIWAYAAFSSDIGMVLSITGLILPSAYH